MAISVGVSQLCSNNAEVQGASDGRCAASVLLLCFHWGEKTALPFSALSKPSIHSTKLFLPRTVMPSAANLEDPGKRGPGRILYRQQRAKCMSSFTPRGLAQALGFMSQDRVGYNKKSPQDPLPAILWATEATIWILGSVQRRSK
jgi:hypothetical protein